MAIDTTSGVITITLPSNPSNFQWIDFLDLKSKFETNNLIIARNGKNIMGLAEDMTINTNNESFRLVYINGDWRVQR